MKNNLLLSIFFYFFIFSGTYCFAVPLTGTKTITLDYSSVQAAIMDLNSQGVGANGVIFNIPSGYSEIFTSPVGGIINITGAQPNSINTITFRKSGAGLNPLITAASGTGTMDGIFVLSGTDYITFDGIDVQENAANVNSTAQMEWGYALLRNSGTDGCQNVIIKNCKISLNKANTNSIAIYSNDHTFSATTALTVTSAAGTNSFNQFYNNILSNCYLGIDIAGYNDLVSPYSFYDQNNQIGVGGANSITNFGGAGFDVYGIFADAQNGIQIANNTVNGGAGTTGSSFYGIATGVNGLNSNVDIFSNTVILSTASASSAVYGIFNSLGASGTNNTVNIYNNTVKDLYWITSVCTFYGIFNSTVATANNLNVFNNTVKSCNVIGTNYISAINVSANVGNSDVYGNTVEGDTLVNGMSPNSGISFAMAKVHTHIHDNRILNNYTLDGVGSTYGIVLASGFGNGAVGTLTMDNNNISNLTSSSPGVVQGIRMNALSGTSVSETIINNAISGLTGNSTNAVTGIYANSINPNTISQNTIESLFSAGGNVAGITINSGNGVSEVNNNTIDKLSTSGNGTVTGYNNTGTANALNLHDNKINTLSSAGGGIITGINLSVGTTVNTYNNLIYDFNSGTATGTAYGISITGGTTHTVYNNMVSDLRAPASANNNAINGLYLNGGTTIKAYYNSVYLNASSSGSPFGTSGIYTNTAPNITMINNLIVNKSSATGAAFTVAHRRSAAATGTLTANYNDYYAGAPGASTLIGYDGTISYQNIGPGAGTYKSWISTETNSINTDPGFPAGTVNDLHQANMSNAAAVKLMGTPIIITTDVDGITRKTVNTDIGYDEVIIVLPIELLSFTGKNQNETNLLEWATSSEINNAYFTLEKSTDAEKFETLEIINGAGNSTMVHNYSLTDQHPAPTTFYRLKQTDFNGQISHSQIIVITKNQGINIIGIFPNPSSDHFQYALSSSDDAQVNVYVVDLLGRKLMDESGIFINKGTNNLSVDVSMFPTGTYLLQVITSSGLYRTQKQLIVK